MDILRTENTFETKQIFGKWFRKLQAETGESYKIYRSTPLTAYWVKERGFHPRIGYRQIHFICKHANARELRKKQKRLPYVPQCPAFIKVSYTADKNKLRLESYNMVHTLHNGTAEKTKLNTETKSDHEYHLSAETISFDDAEDEQTLECPYDPLLVKKSAKRKRFDESEESDENDAETEFVESVEIDTVGMLQKKVCLLENTVTELVQRVSTLEKRLKQLQKTQSRELTVNHASDESATDFYGVEGKLKLYSPEND